MKSGKSKEDEAISQALWLPFLFLFFFALYFAFKVVLALVSSAHNYYFILAHLF
jgi:hypothetical protein